VPIDPITPRSTTHYLAKGDPGLLTKTEDHYRHNLPPLSCDRHHFMDTSRWIFSSDQAGDP
jgi:hypothetical protein